MSEILFHYERVEPTTWAYLSSLLMIGLYFKFNRFWSVRNFDLVLLILLAPGLLLVHYGRERELFEINEALRRGESVPGGVPDQQLRGELGGGADDLDALYLRDRTFVAQAVDANSPDANALDANELDASGSDRSIPESSARSNNSSSPSSSSAPPSGSAVPDTAALSAELESAQNEQDVVVAVRSPSQTVQFLGYFWLIAVGALILIRLLLDPTMVRRPLLEPNLSTGGLIFIGCSLFVFLMANVITGNPTEADLQGPRTAAHLLHGTAIEEGDQGLRRHGPSYAVLNLLPSITTMPLRQSTSGADEMEYAAVAKATAILSHLAIVVGIIGIGYRHFDNLKMGIGVASLYLLLPYTATMTGRVDHVLPAALLVWAVMCYRRPLTAGMFMGLSIGTVYYPLFLLPLWISFYWQRGLMRFVSGVLAMLAVLVVSLVFVSEDSAAFFSKLQEMFGVWEPRMLGLDGVWRLGWDPVYRIPVLAAFIALSGTFAIWPAQKNLGTLLSCSGAIMVATQFWHGFGGGLFMAWYLPLLLLTIFRPNLEDRVALSVLGESWFPRRRHGMTSVERAA